MKATFFGVITWGCTASSWLAKLLNAHPHVFCCHGINKDVQWKKSNSWSFHAPNEIEELIAYCQWLCKHRKYYPVVGNVHGITTRLWRMLTESPEFDSRQIDLRAAILIRHPIVRVESSFHLDRGGRSSRLQQERHLSKYRASKEIAASYGIDIAGDDYDKLAFQWYCDAAAKRILKEVDTGLPVFKMESLVSDQAEGQRLLGHLSDDQLQFSDTTLDTCYTRPVNGHRPSGSSNNPIDVFGGWPDWKKELFASSMTEKSVHTYEELGYEFPYLAPWSRRREAVGTDSPRSLWTKTSSLITRYGRQWLNQTKPE